MDEFNFILRRNHRAFCFLFIFSTTAAVTVSLISNVLLYLINAVYAEYLYDYVISGLSGRITRIVLFGCSFTTVGISKKLLISRVYRLG